MDFFINKNATLPILKLELIQDGRNDFRSFHEKIQNSEITFTMTDEVTGIKKIAKKKATCILKEATCPDEEDEFFIAYKWKERDTKIPGTYNGKFNITFLDDSGTLIVPIKEELKIHIL